MIDTAPYKERALSVFAAMNSRDFSGVRDFFADEMVLDFPGAGRIAGAKKVLIFLKALLRRYPKLTFTVSDVIMEDTRACVVWTNTGERSDGMAYSNSGVTLIAFSEGEIVLLSDYFKDTSFTETKA